MVLFSELVRSTSRKRCAFGTSSFRGSTGIPCDVGRPAVSLSRRASMKVRYVWGVAFLVEKTSAMLKQTEKQHTRKWWERNCDLETVWRLILSIFGMNMNTPLCISFYNSRKSTSWYNYLCYLRLGTSQSLKYVMHWKSYEDFGLLQSPCWTLSL